MSAFLFWAKLMAGLGALAAAVVGWGLVFLQDAWLDDLQGQLTAARQQLAAAQQERPSDPTPTTEAPVQPENLEAEREQARAELDRIKSEEEARAAKLISLAAEIEASNDELERLRAELQKQKERLEDPALAYRTTTRAKMRAGPDTGAAELAVLSANSELRVSEKTPEGTWYKVSVTGYVFHELLQPAANP